MNGTSGLQTTNPQSGPFGLKQPNCTYNAASETMNAKRILPLREFGVVLGSEIMKKAKMSSVPLSI